VKSANNGLKFAWQDYYFKNIDYSELRL